VREFSIFLSRFWVTGPGKKYRGDHLLVAAASYLFTCPFANHIGIFYLPLITIADGLGCSFEEAKRAIFILEHDGFCTYCAKSEYVYVHEMAQIQILRNRDRLKATDKRVKNVHKELVKYCNSIHLSAFYDRYQEAFHLPPITEIAKGITRDIEDPPKGDPIRSLTGDVKQDTGEGEGEGNETGSGDPSEPYDPPSPNLKNLDPYEPEAQWDPNWSPDVQTGWLWVNVGRQESGDPDIELPADNDRDCLLELWNRGKALDLQKPLRALRPIFVEYWKAKLKNGRRPRVFFMAQDFDQHTYQKTQTQDRLTAREIVGLKDTIKLAENDLAFCLEQGDQVGIRRNRAAIARAQEELKKGK